MSVNRVIGRFDFEVHYLLDTESIPKEFRPEVFVPNVLRVLDVNSFLDYKEKTSQVNDAPACKITYSYCKLSNPGSYTMEDVGERIVERIEEEDDVEHAGFDIYPSE